MSERPISLVTGAGRGIGRGIAIELAKLGHAVVINYAGNASAADECLQLVREAGGDGLTVRADISLAEDRARLVSETLAAYGRIDLLVNNAGVAPNVRADILEAGEESFDRLININLKGPYFLTQIVVRQMIAQVQAHAFGSSGLPRIVTISSVSAFTASVNRGDYCIAKAGLGMMTAVEVAKAGYLAMHAGKRQIVHGLAAKVAAMTVGMAPRPLLLATVASLNRKPAQQGQLKPG